ncbi:ABC transporter permease [Tessaracoccus sp. OH4464_COT-324]|uniref:ABC transporter permease n=1 Tax=Tessaracoccus sp. OH4464_COT-324 TaxID=2491059 RepID=UPI000F64399B|nr:ABC transporter permease [Tessaracoccus sp. OH4464_COT-324]RRD46411.1 ABC transporter permease [Tessaracoccus sp. OH4464_COT-324]
MSNETIRPSFWATVGIVAKREVVTRFLSKSFLISTGIMLSIVLLSSIFLPKIGDLLSGESTVAVTRELAPRLQGAPNVVVEIVADEASAREQVRTSQADSAVVADATNPIGLKVLGLREVDSTVMRALATHPNVELLDPDAPHPAVAYITGIGFGMVWMMSAITFGMSIAQSVVEEKQTRIVEILLAAINSRALLTGKILGNSAAALVQVALIVAAVLIGQAVNEESFPLQGIATPLVWFIVLFLVGFVMIAALYAAAAALVSRSEDLGSATQPMIWLVMLPYFAMAFAPTNPTLLKVMTYIPFSTPVAVPMRIFLDQIAPWEPYLALALLIFSTAAIIALAAKIYSGGLLRTGKRVKIAEALRSAE